MLPVHNDASCQAYRSCCSPAFKKKATHTKHTSSAPLPTLLCFARVANLPRGRHVTCEAVIFDLTSLISRKCGVVCGNINTPPCPGNAAHGPCGTKVTVQQKPGKLFETLLPRVPYPSSLIDVWTLKRHHPTTLPIIFVFAPTRALFKMAATTDANCIFCKIIAGQIPSLKLYDSDKTYAFLGELRNTLCL